MRAKGYLLAAISAITYGMIPLFAIPLKQVHLSFDTVLFYRFLISTAAISLLLWYKGIDLRINLKELGVLALLGLMYSGSSEFLLVGYDYMPAGVASTMLFLYPALVAIILSVGFKEKISWIVWVAIGIAFLGVTALNGGGGNAKIPLVGFVIVFLSALAYALYMVIVNKSRIKSMRGMKVSFYSMAFCTIFFLGKSLIVNSFQAIPSFNAGLNLALFAIIPTVISLITLVNAIKLIGSTPASILGAMEPISAVAITIIIFHEPFTVNLAIGITLVLIAVILTVLSDRIGKIRLRNKVR
ncbi:MAG: DMT family transporter [Prevotellaceae bacterium]|jgi:drug/metabolite transporter (DMT)-like permease|nr:DMT family transporter [Prevotellaceae bacterium]